MHANSQEAESSASGQSHSIRAEWEGSSEEDRSLGLLPGPRTPPSPGESSRDGTGERRLEGWDTEGRRDGKMTQGVKGGGMGQGEERLELTVSSQPAF